MRNAGYYGEPAHGPFGKNAQIGILDAIWAIINSAFDKVYTREDVKPSLSINADMLTVPQSYIINGYSQREQEAQIEGLIKLKEKFPDIDKDDDDAIRR